MSTVASLRRVFAGDAKPIGHWRNPDAAFLAVSVPDKGVQSVVRLNGGKIEIRFDGRVQTEAQATSVTSLDLEGVRTDDAVVLFYTEAGMARSALSFDTGKAAGKLRYIVTGLAPGMWEVWRNGWVVDIGVAVRPAKAFCTLRSARAATLSGGSTDHRRSVGGRRGGRSFRRLSCI